MSGTDNKAAIVDKYRATWQFKDALKKIAPDPERRKQCEYDLAEALRLIDSETRFNKSRLTPAKHKKLLQNLATTLRRAVKLAARERQELGTPRRTPWDSRIDDLKRWLKETEKEADNVSKYEIGKGAPRRDTARTAAVLQACNLLEKYGSPPTLYHDGPWHDLAKILLGNDRADLFDYMKVHRQIVECGTE
jgi:hypothetical protein